MKPAQKKNEQISRRDNPVAREGGLAAITGTAARPCHFDLLPAWQRERITRLRRICKSADAARSSRKNISRVLRIAAHRARGKCYLTDPQRELHFSFQTLMRVYYSWRAHGEKAFVLRYQSPIPMPHRRAAAISAAAEPGVITTGRAFQNAAVQHGVSVRSLRRSLAKEVIRELRLLHRARIQCNRAERRFAAFQTSISGKQ